MKTSAPIFRLKRRAKLLAREKSVPLHRALDEVARREGYRSWSHLSESSADRRPAKRMLEELVPGDLVLLGARPGHGKTLLGVELAVEAAKAGRRGFFFSLEVNEAAVLDRLRALGADAKAIGDSLVVDTSDDICANYVAERVRDANADSVVVIDYLQILDQRRSNPELAVQIEDLRRLARDTPSIVVTISQIDRSFELANRDIPGLSDVRLPNPIDLTLFTKTCFMHGGAVSLRAVS
ncbi:DNA helicase [Methylosinus sp. RM1]|uniref:DNA helicase n=1 Tax=Methylosinus sp. RM1 TaxID=2583817 RepID=UPI00140E16E9|nr:DNA helicase [Methylosinus sp. RM1]